MTRSEPATATPRSRTPFAGAHFGLIGRLPSRGYCPTPSVSDPEARQSFADFTPRSRNLTANCLPSFKRSLKVPASVTCNSTARTSQRRAPGWPLNLTPTFGPHGLGGGLRHGSDLLNALARQVGCCGHISDAGTSTKRHQDRVAPIALPHGRFTLPTGTKTFTAGRDNPDIGHMLHTRITFTLR